MSAKYYTHFIAQSDDAIEYSEYRGVVELLGQSGSVQGRPRDRHACWRRASTSRKWTSKCCSGISCIDPIP